MSYFPEIEYKPMQPQRELEVAPGVNSLELLQAIYRSPDVPLPVRIRVAIAALPFETPKLAVTATVDGGEAFGARLERAIARSGVGPKLIEAKAIQATIDRRI